MTFPGTLGTDPSRPSGRKEGTAQGQCCLTFPMPVGPEVERLENREGAQTAEPFSTSLGRESRVPAWNCPCVLVPGSLAGPQRLRGPGYPRPNASGSWRRGPTCSSPSRETALLPKVRVWEELGHL